MRFIMQPEQRQRPHCNKNQIVSKRSRKREKTNRICQLEKEAMLAAGQSEMPPICRNQSAAAECCSPVHLPRSTRYDGSDGSDRPTELLHLIAVHSVLGQGEPATFNRRSSDRLKLCFGDRSRLGLGIPLRNAFYAKSIFN